MPNEYDNETFFAQYAQMDRSEEHTSELQSQRLI